MKLKIVLDNLKFENIVFSSDEEVEKIRDIRNESNVRQNMRTKRKILFSEHSLWYQKMKSSKNNFFYITKYKSQIIGGLGFNNYDKNLLFGEWSYYISDRSLFIGLAAAVEYKAIEFFFNTFKINKLLCYVLKHNSKVIRMHKKFGFNEILFEEYQKNKMIKNQVLNAIYLCLNKKNWILTKKNLQTLFL